MTLRAQLWEVNVRRQVRAYYTLSAYRQGYGAGSSRKHGDGNMAPGDQTITAPGVSAYRGNEHEGNVQTNTSPNAETFGA